MSAGRSDERKELERRRNELLAVFGHETRNSLAAVKNSIECLRAAGLDPAAARDVDVLERQMSHLARLLQDVLHACASPDVHRPLVRCSVRLRDVVSSALEDVRELVKEKSLRVEVAVPAETVLEADPDRLDQIFVNLLTNAAKYSGPGDRIEVQALERRSEVVIRVRDTGVGIAAEDLPHVFNLFYRSRSGGSGLGIGLSVVRELVEQHGGSVEACSRGPGHGSEFVVRLPVGRNGSPPATPGERDEQQGQHSRQPGERPQQHGDRPQQSGDRRQKSGERPQQPGEPGRQPHERPH